MTAGDRETIRSIHNAWTRNKKADAYRLALRVDLTRLTDVETMVWLGSLFRSSGDLQRSFECYEGAYDLNPLLSSVAAHYGHALVSQGRFDDAKRVFLKIPPQDPAYNYALYSLAYNQQQTADNNLIEVLKSTLRENQPKNREKNIALHFALGKCYEDLHKYHSAFNQFSLGASLRRRRIRYNVDEDIRVIKKIIAVFDSDLPDGKGVADNRPIFVVGLPRSGTTLVERIISSHSQVSSIGESSALTHALAHCIRPQGNRSTSTREEAVEQAARINFRELGKMYLREEDHRIFGDKRFVDKMPLNFLYLGLIRKALPESKVLLVRRNPLDNCLAMYTSFFPLAYPFSYRFDELAKYYSAFDLLMRHWSSVCGSFVYQVNYESLVDNFEEQVRGITEFLQLPMEEACIEFYKNTEPTATASAYQVRREVYRSSVGRWRNYRRECTPLLEALLDEGIDLHGVQQQTIGASTKTTAD